MSTTEGRAGYANQKPGESLVSVVGSVTSLFSKRTQKKTAILSYASVAASSREAEEPFMAILIADA
jgi:hypothetical protein